MPTTTTTLSHRRRSITLGNIDCTRSLIAAHPDLRRWSLSKKMCESWIEMDETLLEASLAELGPLQLTQVRCNADEALFNNACYSTTTWDTHVRLDVALQIPAASSSALGQRQRTVCRLMMPARPKAT